MVLEIPEYAYEESREIAVTRLRKENVKECIATLIAENVWKEFDSKDIRDVVKLGRLVSSYQELAMIINRD
ncbi:MAG TPA: hypothetical protein VNA18_00285 [Nitrososphaeraceae archaeon]|nr:hypothetical protein [Nitrososphaeraceae archaeon]